jgi:phosphotransferase system IIB component
MKTIVENINADAKRIRLEMIRAKMPEAKRLNAELCKDLPNSYYTTAWIKFEVNAGTDKDVISKLGLTICKKSEATAQLIIGEQTDTGYFIIGKHKNYWLKSQ